VYGKYKAKCLLLLIFQLGKGGWWMNLLFSEIVCIIAENNTMTADEFINSLSPHLFWDIDKSQFDVEANSGQLIQHVMECGELMDWKLTRDYYGLDRIVADCKKLRTLDPMALSFLCVVSGTNKEDYRCYHFSKKFPNIWNS